MVLHSPPVDRRAGAVPPSVAAAAAAAAAPTGHGEANLLGDLGDADRSLVEEFDSLAGANAASVVVHADVHAATEDTREPAVTVHKDIKTQPLTGAADAADDADRISVADSK